MIPESSPTWTNLLRMDWVKVTPEEPQFYEEQSRMETEEEHKLPEGEMPPELQERLGKDTPFRLRVPSVTNPEEPLVPFTSLLGITMARLGLEENATRWNRNTLIQYVRHTSKPIGIINLTGTMEKEEQEIMFSKPLGGQFHSVTILVFLPGKTGVLVEEDGVPTVSIDKLPPAIQERWKSAGLVAIRNKPVVASSAEPAPATVPLVVQAAQKKGMVQPSAAR